MNDEFIFDLLHKAVKEGEKQGAKFVEARFDDYQLTSIDLTNDIIKESSSKRRRGMGVMAYFNGTPGYSFTPEVTIEGAKSAAKRAANLAVTTDPRNRMKLEFDERPAIKDKALPTIKKHPKDYEFQDKLELLKRGVAAIKENVDATTTQGMYGEFYGEKFFVNSEGSEIFWTPIVVDMRLRADIVENGKRATAGDGMGQSQGLEFFDNDRYSPEIVGANAGKWCKEQLDVVAAPVGKVRVLAGPTLAGVIVHESFGHLSEADFVVTGMSPIADRLGEQLGSEQVTVIDEGVTPYGGWFFPYDDQGTKTGRTVVMDKGILKGYLHDRGTANKMNTEPTGNSVAVSFMFNPICRMKNTYFEKGDLTEEEAIEKVGNGLYAISWRGGTASFDGNFLFNCSRGYLIENGEVTKPIKSASLSGNILELLKHVEGATKNMTLRGNYFGGCGKGEQYPLPVGMGGPEVIMDQVLVGGAQ
ncbi:MAG: TldD/PmbA family protein [Candidatus Heimdallarchaeota archaeon]|nr:TldD/PmbA family protein [Candidatus Heimdallarchaeota archaeon]MCK4876732.1 TldD/PmbA family protein [Candidatus Heimdallarchaeota archaeon]